MSWRSWMARLRESIHAGRIDRDLGEELETHLDLMAEDYVRRGMTPQEARTAARRRLGGLEQTKEAVRERRGLPPIETAVRDVRYALRLLGRSPGFAAAAILTLALGIGANTAIFSLVNAIVLRPLPYPSADRLVSIWEATRTPTGAPDQRIAVAPANLADYARAQPLEAIAAYDTVGRTLSGAGTPVRLTGEEVTASYFAVLGARPALGRVLLPADNQVGAPRVVVLSHQLWRDRFGADAGIVGRTIALDDVPHEVVGVLDENFVGVTSFTTADAGRFWIPTSFDAELLANRNDHEVRALGRLAPTASIDSARAALVAISDRVRQELPQGRGSTVDLGPLGRDLVRDVRPMLGALFGAVGLILLIACVNVANLLIVRSLGRQRELALRLAIGASRGRVISELLTFSLVLATLGTAAGLGLAVAMERWLIALAPTTIPRLDNVSLDWRVLLFTGAVSLLVGIAFGLLPLRPLTRARPVDALKSGDRMVASRWVRRWRSALMVAEIATALALLIGAGLMTRSLIAVNQVDLGFNPDHVLAASISLPRARYETPAARVAFFEDLSARVRALPGVSRVAFSNRLPLRNSWTSGFQLEGVAQPSDEEMLNAGFQAVSPSFFDTLGIRLVAGRPLADSDRPGSEPVAVVSQNFGDRFLEGASPLGRRFRRFEGAPWVTIVGVVSNIRREGKTAPEDPQVYLAAAQPEVYPLQLSELALRVTGDSSAVAPAVLAAVWAIDPVQAVTNVRTLDETLALRLAERRFQTFLFALFAVVAVALAIVGVYGVVSYAAAERRPEIGVRMALGADRGRILAWLLGQTAWLVVAGTACGLGLSLLLSRYLTTLLFRVTPTDAATYAAAAGLLALVAMATSAVVVRAATRLDPTSALRSD